MPVSDLLRAARNSARLDQRTVARRAGVHQPLVSDAERGDRDVRASTLDHLAWATGHRLALIPTAAPSAVETGARIADAIARGSNDGAFRAILDLSDGLAHEQPLVRAALSVAEPASTGSRAWDAALAATVEYRLAQVNLPAPAWAEQERFFTLEPVSPHLHPLDDAADPAKVPATFARHGVLIEDATLASA